MCAICPFCNGLTSLHATRASVGTLACLLLLLHVHCCPTMRRQLHCSSCLPRCRPICEWALSGREGRCQTCSRLGDAAARAQSQVAAYRALQLHAAWPRPHSPCASHPVPATGAHNASAHRSDYQQYLGLITLPTILTPSTMHTIIFQVRRERWRDIPSPSGPVQTYI